MQNANNIFRGGVFCMLPCLLWSGNLVPMWYLWDKFGIGDTEMRGYWNEKNPLTFDNENVNVTTYVQGDKAFVAVANWTKELLKVQLSLDEAKLGLKPSKISLPEVENYIPKGDYGIVLNQENLCIWRLVYLT